MMTKIELWLVLVELGKQSKLDFVAIPTEHEEWDETKWNAWEVYQEWSRKPSWAELVEVDTYLQATKQADRYINGPDDFSTADGLDYRSKKLLGNPSHIDTVRRINWLADQKAGEPVDHSGHTDKLHIGGGVDHMTSLVQLAESATVAGQYIPRMVVRPESPNTCLLYTSPSPRDS